MEKTEAHKIMQDIAASSIEELNELLEEANKVPSMEECIQEINKSNKQVIVESPAQNCKKNFKRKRFFS